MPSSVTDSPPTVQLWFAGPDLQSEYDAQALSVQDREREAARLSGRNAHEWRVSRALRRRLPAICLSSSLSHSHGHALWGASLTHSHMGVDLERVHAVDELAQAEMVAHDDEMRLLSAVQGEARTRLFYRLWTIKEALIKAVEGDFPADMLQVGLRLCIEKKEGEKREGEKGEHGSLESDVRVPADQRVPDDISLALSLLRDPSAGHSGCMNATTHNDSTSTTNHNESTEAKHHNESTDAKHHNNSTNATHQNENAGKVHALLDLRRAGSDAAYLPLRLTGMGGMLWHGVSAMIGEEWMMAAVWPAADDHSTGPGNTVIARLAVPGSSQALKLEQAVYFSTC